MVAGPVSVLLTGASGFIGRHVMRRLSEDGHRIVAIVRSPEAHSLSRSVRFVTADLLQLNSVRELDDFEFDCIVHVAATSPQPGKTSVDICRDNVLATMNLVDWAGARGVRRFIYTSSVSIHGNITVPVLEAKTPIVDPDVYGITKRIGELLLRDATERFASISIRLPGVLGLGASRIWVSRITRRLTDNEDVSIINPKAPFNNAVHVKDLAAFIAHLVTRDTRGAVVFPIGASGSVTIGEIAESLRAAFGSRSAINVVPGRKPSFTISSDEAMRYGYEPKHISNILKQYAYELVREHED